MRFREPYDKWVLLWFLTLLPWYYSGCSGLNAEYSITAETTNTGWEMLSRGKDRKIYRFGIGNVSFSLCGYPRAIKTILVGGPFIPFIPIFYDHSGNYLPVELAVDNPGPEVKINVQKIRVEMSEGRILHHHKGRNFSCIPEDKDICECLYPDEVFRRPDGSSRAFEEVGRLMRSYEKPVDVGLVSIEPGRMLFHLYFPEIRPHAKEFTIVFGDVSVGGETIRLAPLKFTKKFERYEYIPLVH